MRRILFTLMAGAALCVAAPTVALAHGGHHKRHHHSRVRHEKFFAHRHASDATGSPADSSAPTAGMVTSITGNLLTITLADGNTVSGQVTGDTEISCENAAQQTGDNDGDDNGGNEQGDAVFQHSDGGGSGDQGDQGDQGDNNNNQMCTPAMGMSVQKAELTISGNGAFWNEIDLISTTPPTTTTGTGSDS